MSFESAAFVPADPAMDPGRVEAWLDRLAYAYRDPFAPHTWLLVDQPDDVAPSVAAREADPSVHPPGVVVEVRRDRVIVDPHPSDVPWRAREVVAFLMSLGPWEVTTEYGPLGVVTEARTLFPEDG